MSLFAVFGIIYGRRQKTPVSFGTNVTPNSLTEEQKQYFLDCYNKEYDTSLTIKNVDPIWEHYGTYNGVVVLLIYGPNDNPKEIIDINKELILYKNGHFTLVGSAEYNEQWNLVKDALENIKEYHNSRNA